MQRRVYLELSSLKPCPFNLFHWPRSFFNFFAKGTPPPTRMSPEWREVWNELHTIQCMVGDQVRRIDRGLYLDVHWQLEEECRAQGLTGSAFDAAVEAALPQRLAQAIDEAAKGVSTARSHRAIVVQR